MRSLIAMMKIVTAAMPDRVSMLRLTHISAPGIVPCRDYKAHREQLEMRRSNSMDALSDPCDKVEWPRIYDSQGNFAR
jgi:hypothetical protein